MLLNLVCCSSWFFVVRSSVTSDESILVELQLWRSQFKLSSCKAFRRLANAVSFLIITVFLIFRVMVIYLQAIYIAPFQSHLLRPVFTKEISLQEFITGVSLTDILEVFMSLMNLFKNPKDLVGPEQR